MCDNRGRSKYCVLMCVRRERSECVYDGRVENAVSTACMCVYVENAVNECMSVCVCVRECVHDRRVENAVSTAYLCVSVSIK